MYCKSLGEFHSWSYCCMFALMAFKIEICSRKPTQIKPTQLICCKHTQYMKHDYAYKPCVFWRLGSSPLSSISLATSVMAIMMLLSVVKGEQLAIMCKAVSPSSGVTVATDAPWSIRKLAEYWSPATIQYGVLLPPDVSISLCHVKYDTPTTLQDLFDNYHLSFLTTNQMH